MLSKLRAEAQSLRTNIRELTSKTDAIQSEIRDLQEQIMNVGGIKLRTQNSKVEGIKNLHKLASEAITKAEVGLAKAERDLARLQQSNMINEDKLEGLTEELQDIELQLKEKTEAFRLVKAGVDEVKTVMEDKKEERSEIKERLEERVKHLSQFKTLEVWRLRRDVFFCADESTRWISTMHSMKRNAINEIANEASHPTKPNWQVCSWRILSLFSVNPFEKFLMCL